MQSPVEAAEAAIKAEAEAEAEAEAAACIRGAQRWME
jgi:hypothetical protein